MTAPSLHAYTVHMLQAASPRDDIARDPGGAVAPTHVRQFRQILLWPLRLITADESSGGGPGTPWQALIDAGPHSPWHEVVDEYTGESARFHERHYNEFVTFLPYVQRFLYGEGRSSRAEPDDAQAGAPMRVFRRHDVAAVRIVTRAGELPVVLQIVHVDLYFFYDVDVVLLNLELAASDLPLALAQELMYRFGRGYPGGWDSRGDPTHCVASAEWLDAGGRVLAQSDASDREAFLAHVCEHRAPRLAAHWAFLLKPLVSDHSGSVGALRFRQIEYYRMPMMAYHGAQRSARAFAGRFCAAGARHRAVR